MKIAQLDIEGFRSLKKVSWKPGDLNVVIGPNGSGKSNLLQMLELISVAARGGLGKYVQNLGGMGALVWDGEARNIDFTVKTSGDNASTDTESDTLDYVVQMERTGATSAFRIGFETLVYRRNRPEVSLPPADYPFFERKGQGIVFFAKGQPINVPEGSVPQEETNLCASSGVLVEKGPLLDFHNHLSNWAVYLGMRTDRFAPIRQAAVTRHERRVDPDGQNLVPVLHTLYTEDRNFKTAIDSAMSVAFGDEYETLLFPPAASERIEMQVRWKTLNRGQSADGLSDGTLRFLFLLAVLGSPDSAPLIAIDEPETGLHPSMFPIIAEYAAGASKRSQIIFTTHSPEFLNAFGDVRPTTTVVTCAEGETTLRTLAGEEFDRWLKEYTLGELFASGELEQME